ncbi:uncharacterized protein SI:DKEY-33C12.4 isoform X2 [Latimeria chalumnae]|uniref:uncharacterized protein SI:DKEY-33C12.4 isoform X2 n=1 Tax=Latimeria chalumnae TaxID=7897 RepID=UPI00313E825F
MEPKALIRTLRKPLVRHRKKGLWSPRQPVKRKLILSPMMIRIKKFVRGRLRTASLRKRRSQEEEDVVEDAEGELDMTSSFVSKAASILRRKMDIRPKVEKKEKPSKKSEKLPEKQEVKDNNDAESLHTRSLQLAVIGNEMANTGSYGDAIIYFTEAIKYNPGEYRLFGNRSYCYERLQQYDKALNDAEIALSISPNWPKGYFRKGRALAGLKRFAEAVAAFKEVLKIDRSCGDAAHDLARVQVAQLMELGFTKEQSENAINICGSVQKALEVLVSDGLPNRSYTIADNAYVVHNQNYVMKPLLQPALKLGQQLKSIPVNVQPQQPKPRELYPVWVGNVTNRITEMTLRTVFGTAGPIYGIRMLYDRYCAFVNFGSKEAAEKAFDTLQGLEVDGTKLVLQLKHPDHAAKTAGGLKPTAAATAVPAPAPPASNREKVKIPSTLECHFWRNKGCVYGDTCRFLHSPENRGIDQTPSSK